MRGEDPVLETPIQSNPIRVKRGRETVERHLNEHTKPISQPTGNRERNKTKRTNQSSHKTTPRRESTFT